MLLTDEFAGLVRGRSADGEVSLLTMGKELDESFVDEDFDMEKLWAYLTIKDLLKNKTHNADNEVNLVISNCQWVSNVANLITTFYIAAKENV